MELLNPILLHNFLILKDRLRLLKYNLQRNKIKLSNSSKYTRLSKLFRRFLSEFLEDRLRLLKYKLQTSNIKLSNSSEYARLSTSFYRYSKKLGLNKSLRPTKIETLNRFEFLKKKVEAAKTNLQIECMKPGYSKEALSSAEKACSASQKALYRCSKKLGVQKVRNNEPLIFSASASKKNNSIVCEELQVQTKQMEFDTLKKTYKINGWRCKGDPEYNRVNVALCWLKKKRQSKLDELYPVVD